MASSVDLVTDSVADLSEPEKNFKTMSTREKFDFVKKIITVEPLIACYYIPYEMCYTSLVNLRREKSCKATFGFNDTVCDSILRVDGDYKEENFLVLEKINNVDSWINSMKWIPFILILFVASYSDRHCIRKPFLIIPLIGELFDVFGCALSVYFMRELPYELLQLSIGFIPLIFGGEEMINVMLYSYIADISTLEMRTLRMTCMSIFISITDMIVTPLGPTAFNYLGYSGILAVSAAIYSIGILWGIIYLKEPREKITQDKTVSLLADMFHPKCIVDTLSVLVKKNNQYSRKKLFIIMFLSFLASGQILGVFSIFEPYVNIAFNWSPGDTTYFLSFLLTIFVIGRIIAPLLFTILFKLSDYMFIVVCFVDHIIMLVILALAKTTTMFYIGAGVGLIAVLSPLIVRSLITKVVSENDTSKAQTLIGMFETLGVSLFTIVYPQIFNAIQRSSFLSGIYLFGAGMMTIATILVFVVRSSDEKEAKQKCKSEDMGESNDIDMKSTETTHI